MIKELLQLYREYVYELQEIDINGMGGFQTVKPTFEGFMNWLEYRESQILAEKATNPLDNEPPF